MERNEFVKLICEAALDKKAEKVCVIDVEGMTAVADDFIICNGNSKTQVKAICDNVEEKASEKGVSPLRIDGYEEARWAIIDYGDVIFHVFAEEERQFYALERLWNNGNNAYIYSEE